MRVAVFEPFPRLCGVTTWAFHLVEGFRSLGHAADVVTFTKSGKASAVRSKTGGPRLTWQWNPNEPDVVAKFADAVDVLRGYDLVVLNEPKNPVRDREASKSGGLPSYIVALGNAGVPWTTAIHDIRAYDEKRAPFIRELFQTTSFAGWLIECRVGVNNAIEARIGHRPRALTWPWLPYIQRGKRPDVQRMRLITLGTRITNHKGLTALVDVANELPENWAVELFGGESGGTGPCHTYVIYEALARSHGWFGQRLGNGTQMDEIGNMASVQSPYRWRLEKDGHRIQYTGPYLDVMEPWSRAAIAMNLSTDQVVSSLEYATLEAIDAGCVPVWPKYYTADTGAAPYVHFELERYRHGTAVSGKDKLIRWSDPPETRKELVNVLRLAIDRVERGQWNPAVNREVLDRWHHPRHLAEAILKEVGRV